MSEFRRYLVLPCAAEEVGPKGSEGVFQATSFFRQGPPQSRVARHLPRKLGERNRY